MTLAISKNGGGKNTTPRCNFFLQKINTRRCAPEIATLLRVTLCQWKRKRKKKHGKIFCTPLSWCLYCITFFFPDPYWGGGWGWGEREREEFLQRNLRHICVLSLNGFKKKKTFKTMNVTSRVHTSKKKLRKIKTSISLQYGYALLSPFYLPTLFACTYSYERAVCYFLLFIIFCCFFIKKKKKICKMNKALHAWTPSKKEKSWKKKKLGGNSLHGCCQIWPDLETRSPHLENEPDLGNWPPNLARSGSIRVSDSFPSHLI